MNFLLKIKLLILGESSVGKTALLKRFSSNEFHPTSHSTYMDLHTSEIVINDEKIMLQIWDTAGQERYQSITLSLYKGSNGVVLVFDLTNRQSFDKLKGWIAQISEILETGFQIILVGTKADLIDQIRVKQEEIDEFVNDHDFQFTYFKTSSLEGTNVRESFIYLAEKVYYAIQSENVSKNGKATNQNHQSTILIPENHTPQTTKKERKCC